MMKKLAHNLLDLRDPSVIVFINQKNLAVPVPPHSLLTRFAEEENSSDRNSNFITRIEKFGVSDHEPLVVVRDRNRTNGDFYLIIKGQEQFLSALELRPDIECFPCLIVNEKLTDAQASGQNEEIIKTSQPTKSLALTLLNAMNESYENSGRKSMDLSTETKKIIAQDLGYENFHLKSISRALAPLRDIFERLVCRPENAKKTLLEIMLLAANDIIEHPELFAFMSHNIPARFYADYKMKKNEELEIRNEISLTSNFDFIINSTCRATPIEEAGS